MNVSLIDWYPGFEFRNELIKDILEQSLGAKLTVVDSHLMADVVLVGPYGNQHKHAASYINSNAWKLYFTGENTVPDFRYVHHSLTFIRHDFNGRNFRLPLWWLHLTYPGYRESPSFNLADSIEFFRTNLPLQKYSVKRSHRQNSVVAVFNHPDPLRLWTVQELSKRITVEKYGQCFGNGFAWGDDGYHKKIQLLSKYRFNYCPENSLSDGYFTEKILHARLTGCIPIVYADKYVSLDFNTIGLINIYDFESMDAFVSYVCELSKDDQKMEQIASEPICMNMPNIDLLVDFLRRSYSCFMLQNLPQCTDVVHPVTHVEKLSLTQKVRRRLTKLFC